MEEHFKKFKESGKNSVDSLLQWLQESKLVANSEEAKDKARKLFDDVKNKQDVEIDKFKEVVKKLAEEQQKNFDDFVKTLEDAVPKFQEALAKAAEAFQEAMAKK